MFKLGFLILCTGALAQYHGVGKCPAEIRGVRNFKKKDYMGIWYQVETYSVKEDKCKYDKYILNSNNTITVVEGIVDAKGSPVTSPKGKMKFIGNANDSRWSIEIPGQIIHQNWILDTDYKNYAVLASCISLLIIYEKNVWILSRKRVLAKKFQDKAYQVLKKYKMRTSSLEKTHQKNCPVIRA